MSNHATTTAPAFTESNALFARKLAFAQSVFAQTREANDIDVQPYVTTIHSQLCGIVRTTLADALRVAAPAAICEESRQQLADAVVDAGWDCDYDIAGATTYIISRFFSEALHRFEEASDDLREDFSTQATYDATYEAYLNALVLLNATIGRQVMEPTKFQCTECDKIHNTFAAAARCHHGIGGVIEIDAEGNEVQS